MRVATLVGLFASVSLAGAAGYPPVRRQDTTVAPPEPTTVTSETPTSTVTETPTSTTTSETPTSSPPESTESTSSPPSSTSQAPSTSSETTPSEITTPIPTVSATPAPSPTPIFQPVGGQGFNITPSYKPQSDFDFQSINLALHQDLFQLDLFGFGLATFNESDFEDAGLTPEDTSLLEYFAEQEAAHVTLLENILFPNVTQQCTYTYPNFTDARAFIDFCHRVTSFGESGTIGFLAHLDAQDTASLLVASLVTASRQQMLFRQLEGLFPVPFSFAPSITPSMQWTLLSPYIATCPEGNPTVNWTNFPALNVSNGPFFPDIPLDNTTDPAITHNRTSVTFPGRETQLSWDAPGQQVGFNGSFTTNSTAGPAQFAAWISQLNTTYTALENITSTNGITNATTLQPGGEVFENDTAPLINGTVYLLIMDAAIAVTPYNLSQIEAHIVAGPALFQAG